MATTNLAECFYCGTKNNPVCCDRASEILRDRIIATLRGGDPSHAVLEEIAKACVKQAEEHPESLAATVRWCLPDRI